MFALQSYILVLLIILLRILQKLRHLLLLYYYLHIFVLFHSGTVVGTDPYTATVFYCLPFG